MSSRRQSLLVALFAVGLAACRRGEAGQGLSEGVRFTAEAAIVGDASDGVLLRIKATNRAREGRMVEIHHCEVSVAVLTGRGNSTRVWDRSAWLRSRQGGEYPAVCLTYALMKQIAPGDSVDTFRLTVSSRDVLADSLPTGPYRAIIGGDAKLQGGLRTGDFDLRR